MGKIHVHTFVLAILIGLQAVAGSAAFASTLNVGKADANASAIIPVNVAEKLASSRNMASM